MAIFLKDDWDKYPRAIADINTTNRSWVRQAHVYKKMGIKNYKFCLTLLNPDLVGVDPFNPNLTLTERGMISVECKLNVWYYLREVLRVPGQVGAAPTRLRCNRSVVAMVWLYGLHITSFNVQPRQTGKTLISDAIRNWLINIAVTDYPVELLTQNDTTRKNTMLKQLRLLETLPGYLRMYNAKKDVANSLEVSVKRQRNLLRCHLSNRNPDDAVKAGRSLTSATINTDETSYIPNLKLALTAALPAMGAAKEVAKAANAPYGIIHTSTAGKKDDRDGGYAYTLFSESAAFSEKMFDAKDMDDLEQLIRNNSVTGKFAVACEFNHRQLGKTDAWLRQELEESGATGEEADRDYFNRWTSGSQSSPFSVEDATRMRDGERETVYTEVTEYNYIIRWYIAEHEIDRIMNEDIVVAGLDTSDATGGDDIALIFRNIRDGRVLAVGQYNETNTITFAEWLVSLLVKYPKLLMIIERRSTAITILDHMLKYLPVYDINPFARIYNTVVNNADIKPNDFERIKRGRPTEETINKFRKSFGFATSGSGVTSRSTLFSETMSSSVKTCAEHIYDKRTIDQLLGLVKRNGRIDHEVGGNDDLVIAWLLAYHLMIKGKNLSYYGIKPSVIMEDYSKSTRPDITPEEAHKVSEQKYYKNKIEELMSLAKNTHDTMMLARLENEIRAIMSRIDVTSEERIAIDAVIEQLKEQTTLKRMKALNNRYHHTPW